MPPRCRGLQTSYSIDFEGSPGFLFPMQPRDLLVQIFYELLLVLAEMGAPVAIRAERNCVFNPITSPLRQGSNMVYLEILESMLITERCGILARFAFSVCA